jgi:hypothetical protein
MNQTLEIPKDIFHIGVEKESDITEKVNSDIVHDIKDSNDIVIEMNDLIDNINVPIIARLKPSTIKNLDDIAYRSRRSRNYVIQQLLDQAIKKLK